jgi:chemosensory pili system protein ChpA (sensor histidine kinase/response regulator)
MRSWIEIDSIPGEGTTIRLSIPLRSVIEHAMVFRCGGRLFAVPMQYVRGAGDAEDESAKSSAVETVSCHDLFRLAQPASDGPRQRLVIGFGRRTDMVSPSKAPQFSRPGQQRAILVDEILGPEEVVVRPLPPLLRHQSLVSGITLSGTGELLLLCDSQHLMELSNSAVMSLPKTDETTAPQCTVLRQRVLVVDDSISARRTLTRPLKNFGLNVVEAADGIEALEHLRSGRFAAVFSDLEMPRLGGLDLLRELAASDPSRRVPVIIVSSCDEQRFGQQATDLGAVAYLTKPASEARIAEELRRLGLLPATRQEGEVS